MHDEITLRNLDLRYKLTEKQKKDIIELRINGVSQQALGEKFGCSQSYISRIV